MVVLLFATTGFTFLFGALSWWDEPTRSLLVRSAASANLMAIVFALLACISIRALRKDPLAIRILFAFSPIAFGMFFGTLVEFGWGENGPGMKPGILVASAILENALTTFVLVHEVHRREKARIALERDFHRRVVERSDDHREELARELHDSLCQQVSSLRMRIFSLLPEDRKTNLTEIGTGMERLSQDIRRMSHQIHPPLLEYGRLFGAIAQLCEEMSQSAQSKIEFRHPETELQIPKSMAIHLYRIVQEALSNAVRHGRASRIKVEIQLAQNRLELVVADDGLGFPANGISSGLGMWSIRSRVESLGGSFRILSSETKGARLDIGVPFHPAS